jgi:hypothetical protein
MKRLLILFVLLIFISSLVSQASAAQFRNEDSLSIEEPSQEDSFFTGQNIQVKAPVSGELFVAANSVEITAKPTRSLFAAGNTVRITDGAGYNVFSAGNTLVIGGTIEHDVYLGGRSIELEPNTHIKGSLRVSGTIVKLAGKIDGDVSFSTRRIESSAEIGKSMTGNANQVVFTEGGISGDLIYNSNQEAAGLEAIKISGKTERLPLAVSQTSQFQNWLLGVLTAFITGAALLLLIPVKIRELSHTIRQEWGKLFLVGLGTLVLSPIAIILLFSSVVAWPLALIWSVLLVILIYISFIISEMMIGMYLLKRLMPNQDNWWIALLVGIILISLIRIIPVLGPILLIVMLIGLSIPLMGAVLLWWKNKLSS